MNPLELPITSTLVASYVHVGLLRSTCLFLGDAVGRWISMNNCPTIADFANLLGWRDFLNDMYNHLLLDFILPGPVPAINKSGHKHAWPMPIADRREGNTKLPPTTDPHPPTMSIPFPPEDLPEMFSVMKEQEVSSYKVEDYLNPNYQVPRAAPGDLMCMPPDAGPATSSTHSVGTNSSAAGVNEDWRGKICEWSYQVIDHFDYDREIVAVSVHYLDRYLCQRPVNKRTFQLCAMTTLFMACKLYDLNKLRMSAIIELSRGCFTEEHITAMEMSILKCV